jgi:hypothetical protein
MSTKPIERRSHRILYGVAQAIIFRAFTAKDITLPKIFNQDRGI